MITYSIIVTLLVSFGLITGLISIILSFFGASDIVSGILPFGIDSLVQMGFGYFNYFSVYIPPLATLLIYFKYLLYWKIAMGILSMIPFLNRFFNKTT